MYSIVLTDGKVIKIDADVVEWLENSKMIRFIKGKKIIARFDMENVAGWAETDCMAESEEYGWINS